MRRIPVLVLLASLPLAVLCLLAISSRWWYAGEIGANCSLHAALLLLPALIVWRKSPLVSGSLILCLAIGISPWLRAAWEPRAPVADPQAMLIPVASANLFIYNQQRAAAVQAALAQNAKILVLEESISSEDRPLVSTERYPYQIWETQNDRKWRDCVALLSVYPIEWQQAFDRDRQTYIAATLNVNGRPLHVIAVHTFSPHIPQRWVGRNEQLARIVQTITVLQERRPAPVLLLGDWNLTVGSAAWRDFHQTGGVRRASQREPISWPSFFGPFGITIDHILGINLALGPQHSFIIPGSDHHGLNGTIQLP